jgi:beta-N-acetylhexosaminidase
MAGVLIDIEGTKLTDLDKGRLANPACVGVIFFSRNYVSREQIKDVIREIRELRTDPLLVCVDQEGGRVQRFRESFTRIPPMAYVGQIWDKEQKQGVEVSRALGVILGSELREIDVDLTFAPVLDLNRENSSVIGDRSFHRDPEVVTLLAEQFMLGLREVGVRSVGKHFPGHGGISEDTHTEQAIDLRSFKEIDAEDLRPFRALSRNLDGVMPAHVTFPDLDSNPACFSSVWLKDVLREALGFKGLVFSDDLSMHAATQVGPPVIRANKAVEAGCDVVLVCNAPDDADAVLSSFGESVFLSGGLPALWGAKMTGAGDGLEALVDSSRELLRKAGWRG